MNKKNLIFDHFSCSLPLSISFYIYIYIFWCFSFQAIISQWETARMCEEQAQNSIIPNEFIKHANITQDIYSTYRYQAHT